MKLLNKIKENAEIKIRVLPFIPVVPNRVLNSLCRVLVIRFHNTVIRVGINQNIIGIMIIAIIVDNQLIDKLNIDVDGSNTENRFVITFNYLFLD